MSVATFTKAGAKATSATTLQKDIFAVEVTSHDLLQQAYLTYQSNGRTVNAKTKTRGEVSGGGRKPWKQKGTGRARFGSIRVPIWRGGGITFGPTGTENFTKKLPVSAKKNALRQALSLANKSNKISVIETFECKNGKVAETKKLLDKIGAKGQILMVVSVKDEMVVRATNNLENLKVVQATYLNVFDIMNADTIVISQKSLDLIVDWLKPAAKREAK